MPQLDIFIFVSSGIYLFLGFFSLLAYIHIFFLPSLGSLIKLRRKMVSSNSINQDSIKASEMPKMPDISLTDHIFFKK